MSARHETFTCTDCGLEADLDEAQPFCGGLICATCADSYKLSRPAPEPAGVIRGRAE